MKNDELEKEEKNEIAKYYLHYIDEQHTLDQKILKKIDSNFSDDNISFREKLYTEIEEKYLLEREYDPITVIAGLRIKIEEIIYHKLDQENKEPYINKHTVINKLDYALAKGIDVPELFLSFTTSL